MAKVYIEDLDIENWQLFYESKKNYYYVSDKGRVKYKNKNTKRDAYLKVIIRDNKAVVRVNQKFVQVKNLVAKNFVSREYYKIENPVVINIDGDPYNCSIENLQLLPWKEFRKTYTQKRYLSCVLYENGIPTKTFRSLREAGKELFYNAGDISTHFTKGVPKKLPFDLRLL